jgi:hypothetical protein
MQGDQIVDECCRSDAPGSGREVVTDAQPRSSLVDADAA